MANSVQADVSLALNYQEQSSEIVRTAIKEQQAGVAGLLYGKKLQEVSSKQILQIALKQAPQILANQQRRIIAEAGVVQQEAAFDWVFSADTSLTITNFNARSDSINRERVTNITISGDDVSVNPDDEQEVAEDGVPIAVADSAGNLLCVTVAGEVVNEEQCALNTEVSTKKEFAAGSGDSTNALTLTTRGSKQLGNGSQAQIGLGISRRTKNFYPLDDLGLIGAQSNTDPIGKGSRFPWTSRIFFSYSIPIGKNSGRYGSVPSLGRELSIVNNQHSRFSEKAVGELLLLQVDSSYWSHVKSLLNLQSANQRLRNTNERLKSAERKFKSRSLTNYELLQVRQAVANASAQLQNAWFSFIKTTQNLAQLVGVGNATVILPTDFNSDLYEHKELNRKKFRKNVLQNNPSLNASREEIKSSEILLKNAKQNLKSDLSLAISLELSQSDRVLGYEGAGDSLGSLFDPDNTRWFIGLQYKLPFGRNAEKARHSQANIALNQSRESQTLQEMQISAEINELVARNDTTESQLAFAQNRLSLAQVAYDKGIVARGRGNIPEFEFLTILDDLDSARRGWINQLIAQQQINAQALLLEGKLSATVGDLQ